MHASTSTKKVRFSANNKVHEIRKLSVKEQHAMWLSNEDIATIREENKILVNKAKDGMYVETACETLRGLEHMIEDHNGVERRANAFGAVMFEQGITNNPDRIAHVYHVSSRNASKLAWLMGQQDSIATMLSTHEIDIAMKKPSMLTRACKVTVYRMTSLLSRRWSKSFDDDATNLVNSRACRK